MRNYTDSKISQYIFNQTVWIGTYSIKQKENKTDLCDHTFLKIPMEAVFYHTFSMKEHPMWSLQIKV